MTEQHIYASPDMANILQALLRGDQVEHLEDPVRFDRVDLPTSSTV